MTDLPDDLDAAQALRDDLHGLPVAAVSPDFDARVLAALHLPRPWGKTRWERFREHFWEHFWEPARPLLLGASCSLAVTLLALHWTLSGPVSAPRPPAPSEQAVAPPAVPAPSLDALLDRPDLRAGSLAAWTPPAPAPGRRPAPPRHAQAGRRTDWIV